MTKDPRIFSIVELELYERDVINNLRQLEKTPDYNTAPMNDTWQRTLDLVKSEASGENTILDKTPDELEREIASLIQKAIDKKEIAPNFSAYCFALAAKHREAKGENYDDLLVQAMACLDESYAIPIPKNSPSSWLPEAIIIGIMKRHYSLV